MSVAASLDDDLLSEIRALLSGEQDYIANAANVAAMIFTRVPRLNWAGFYFLQNDTLVLGPFQGQPACTRIKLGQGVCGTAAARNETIVVPDVHEFPGHIACDAASQSEIVVPVNVPGRVTGVLDVDSPEPNRFGPAEQALMEAIANLYGRACQSI